MSSCYSCNLKFSLIKKEKACSVCRLPFCSDCLKKDNVHGTSEKLCYSCLKNCNQQQVVDPPAALLKRLETLDNPSKPPVTIIRNTSKYDKLKAGLTEKDIELITRLEKLKEKAGPPIPSTEEINARLAALKGVTPTPSQPESNQSVSIPKAPLTSAEQVDALLMEYMEEASIDGAEGLESKMAETGLDESSDDEETAAAQVVKRVIDEAALPGTGELTPPEPVEDELPWCELCNTDATIRCLDCDGALYCKRCLRESHDRFELKEHRTKPFRH